MLYGTEILFLRVTVTRQETVPLVRMKYMTMTFHVIKNTCSFAAMKCLGKPICSMKDIEIFLERIMAMEIDHPELLHTLVIGALVSTISFIFCASIRYFTAKYFQSFNTSEPLPFCSRPMVRLFCIQPGLQGDRGRKIQ